MGPYTMATTAEVINMVMGTDRTRRFGDMAMIQNVESSYA
jgi:hypothetical protein